MGNTILQLIYYTIIHYYVAIQTGHARTKRLWPCSVEMHMNSTITHTNMTARLHVIIMLPILRSIRSYMLQLNITGIVDVKRNCPPPPSIRLCTSLALPTVTPSIMAIRSSGAF